MADSQPTLFDIETLPGMACHKPTKKYPGGRAGTSAGSAAHYQSKEKPCEDCAKGNRDRSSKYYDEKRDEVLERKRARYADNPEKHLDYNRQHPPRIPAQALELKKKWEKDNDDLMRAYRRKWAKRNPWKIVRKEHNRRARTRNLPNDGYTHDDVTRAHGKMCYLCDTEVDITLPHGTPDSPEIDHIHPISRPECPGNILSNVRWAHASCNRFKGAKMVSELTLPFPAPQGVATELPDPPVQAQ